MNSVQVAARHVPKLDPGVAFLASTSLQETLTPRELARKAGLSKLIPEAY